MDSDPNLTDTGLEEARLAASAAAVAGDTGTLYHLVSRLMDEGLPFESVLFDVLVPTQRDVGTRWQAGDYLVSEEHAATATVETVVSLLAGAFDQPTDGRYVVVAAAEGDHHSLPARLVSAYLLFLEYRTTFLGANVLAADLHEYLEVEPPEALVVSCAMTGHLLGARATIRAGHAARTPVIVGGRGLGATGEWAPLVGADAWAGEPRYVAEILDSWSPDIGASEAGALDPTPELSELVGRRSAVLAAAQDVLERWSIPIDARIRDELSILQGAVEASLLLADDTPTVEALAWQRSTLAAHRIDQGEALGAALATALSTISSPAAVVLNRSIQKLAAIDQG
jgi:methanogenic corrinoid protein MtbC1